MTVPEGLIDPKSYYEGVKDGLDLKENNFYKLFGFDDLLKIIVEYEAITLRNSEKSKKENKMAARLIKQSDLEVLFPNERQRKMFLNIMSHLIVVEPDEKEDDINIIVIEAMRKAGYSGSVVMMELKRVGLKIVKIK